MLTPEELIKAKRDGEELDEASLRSFADGIGRGQVGDAQIGAFVMAVYLQGMASSELLALTLAMRDSGRSLVWQDLNGPVLDKHSTGGVGDLVTLVLAPLIAACGGFVPTITGRGLGHTGGTLDKLESIPGFEINLSPQLFEKTVRTSGLSIVGQSADLAPADGRLYAVRDVTSTVSSVPLIVSSILSKKLAEGLDGLVLDIKTGNGAVMCERNRSRDLATNLVEIASMAGLPCHGLITDMNQPLARSAGNALELREAIDFLKMGRGHNRLSEVTLSLAGELMLLGGLESSLKAAKKRLVDALKSGNAAERFARMVKMQGGPADLLENPEKYLPAAPVVKVLESPVDGFVAFIDTRAVGMCVVSLGGGRKQVGDSIDHRVGLTGLCRVGDRVGKGQALAVIHAADESDSEIAANILTRAIRVGRKTDVLPAVYERITSNKSK